MLDGDLLFRGIRVARALAHYARPHKRRFIVGFIAGIGVVFARLALPWPLRWITEIWGGEAASGHQSLSTFSSFDRVQASVTVAAIFVIIIFLLGLVDAIERINFAKFATGTIRDLRSRLFQSVANAGRIPASGGIVAAIDESADSNSADTEEREIDSAHYGDLITRILSDTARVKSGLQSFFVHVVPSGTLFLGVIVILFLMSPAFAGILAIAAVGTALMTYWAAVQMFRSSVASRTREGELAEEIHSILQGNSNSLHTVKLNKSSARYQVRQKKAEGTATLLAHVLFGTAIFICVLVGVRAVEAGQLDFGDILVLMIYALLLRGPMVRLTRQGCRTGRIIGVAERVIRAADTGFASNVKKPPRRLPVLRDSIRLDQVRSAEKSPPNSEPSFGPIDLEIPVGQKIAVFGENGFDRSLLLQILDGTVDCAGKISWDGIDISDTPENYRFRKIKLVPSDGAPTRKYQADDQYLNIIAHFYSNASVWLFDDPGKNLAKDPAERLVQALAQEVRKKIIVVAFAEPAAIDAFDRVLFVRDGRIAFDGSPSDWIENRDPTMPSAEGFKRNGSVAAFGAESHAASSS